jgi:putative phage-type endonuclease
MKTVVFNTDSGSPDTPEWHKWRSEHVTATDSTVIAAHHGLVPRAAWTSTLTTLYNQKLGLIPPVKSNPAMERGKKYEERAREWYIAQTGNRVLPYFGEMDAPNNALSASLDGLDFTHQVILEIKVPSQATIDDAKNGKIPEYYRAQMAHQALVVWGPVDTWKAGAILDFVAYDWQNEENSQIVRIDPVVDIAFKGLARAILPVALEFHVHLTTQTPPGQEVDLWNAAAKKFRKAKDLIDEASKLKDEAEVVLQGLLGSTPKRSGGGISMSQYVQEGAVDYKKLLEGAVSIEALKKVLPDLEDDAINNAKFTENDISSFRKGSSTRCKISVEKDFVDEPVMMAPEIESEEMLGERDYVF